MTLGPGIRGDLNEIYQRAKQNDAIVETLELETAPKPQKPTRDWRPLLDEVVQPTEQLRQVDNVVQSRAFSLLKASARLAQVAAHDPEQLENLDQLARRTVTALRQLETALERAQAARLFLGCSGKLRTARRSCSESPRCLPRRQLSAAQRPGTPGG